MLSRVKTARQIQEAISVAPSRLSSIGYDASIIARLDEVPYRRFADDEPRVARWLEDSNESVYEVLEEEKPEEDPLLRQRAVCTDVFIRCGT